MKTPMPVNSCVESILGPTYRSDDYGVGLVLAELLTYSHLHPLIREKGGAYEASLRLNESGMINFLSFRDPAIVRTFENFERTIIDACDGKFSESEIDQAKLLAFQKIDKVLEPSYKGLLGFVRGYSDEDRLNMRLRALDADKERLVDFARKYFLPALEEGKTARVVFGTQDIESSGDYEVLQSDAWTFHNPMSFLSSKYFEEKKNE